MFFFSVDVKSLRSLTILDRNILPARTQLVMKLNLPISDCNCFLVYVSLVFHLFSSSFNSCVLLCDTSITILTVSTVFQLILYFCEELLFLVPYPTLMTLVTFRYAKLTEFFVACWSSHSYSFSFGHDAACSCDLMFKWRDNSLLHWACDFKVMTCICVLLMC